MEKNMDWYYAVDNQRMGPVSEEEFQRLVAQGVVTPETLVWQSGLTDWQPYGQLQPAAPPPPPDMGPPPQEGPAKDSAWISGESPAMGGQPQQQTYSYQPAPDIPNFLVQSILVTICCCLPLGIPAIVFAAQVNGYIAAGDLQRAQDASNKAKMFSWWAFGLGLAINLIYPFAMVVRNF